MIIRFPRSFFKGAKNTYVYDTTEVRLHMETFLDFYENIPVPLQGMNADNYEILRHVSGRIL